MLNEEQILKIINDIDSKKEQMNVLDNEVRTLEKMLTDNKIEIAQSAFKDINPGDKVIVTIQGTDWRGNKYKLSSEPLFFEKITGNKYDVISWFFRMKKDGTPSKRNEYYYFRNIVSIEKVIE